MEMPHRLEIVKVIGEAIPVLILLLMELHQRPLWDIYKNYYANKS